MDKLLKNFKSESNRNEKDLKKDDSEEEPKNANISRNSNQEEKILNLSKENVNKFLCLMSNDRSKKHCINSRNGRTEFSEFSDMEKAITATENGDQRLLCYKCNTSGHLMKNCKEKGTSVY